MAAHKVQMEGIFHGHRCAFLLLPSTSNCTGTGKKRLTISQEKDIFQRRVNWAHSLQDCPKEQCIAHRTAIG